MARWFFLPILVAALLLFARPASAQSDNQDWDGGFSKKAERRSDFVLGLSPLFAVGSAAGYPNEIDKIDDPAYEATTGVASGGGFAIWVGGALTDWFTFGVGPNFFYTSGDKGKTGSGGVLFRLETFPLYGLGGNLRDLALFATFGAGGLNIEGKNGEKGDGGFGSLAGVGAAYELFRFGHFALAPTAQWLLVNSQSINGNFALIGVRGVYYGGPS